MKIKGVIPLRKVLLYLLFGFIAVGLCGAKEAKVTIIYSDAAQFEVTSPEGTRVMIDVANPGLLSKPETSQDILLTTHDHPDHFEPSFVKSFPGKKLTIQTGAIEAAGVKITGIASSHSEYGQLLAEGGSNYIFLMEIGGLRIAHFGDIGQKSLTQEQLKVLGEIDIALTQFGNSYSSMDIENLKGFNLMDQLKPKLIIPTHMDEATTKYAVQKWDSFYYDQPLTVGKADLTGKSKIIFISAWGDYVKSLKLAKEWNPGK